MREAQPTALSLELVVEYRLGEYLRTLCDYLPVEHRRRAELKGEAGSAKLREVPWHAKALLYCIGSVAFFYKVRKVGACRFKIDERGVERISKGGKLESPWRKITGVLTLGESYLVQKANGAMPIPFRCMSLSERMEFERLVKAKLSSTGVG
jgi:hypothetical protein